MHPFTFEAAPVKSELSLTPAPSFSSSCSSSSSSTDSPTNAGSVGGGARSVILCGVGEEHSNRRVMAMHVKFFQKIFPQVEVFCPESNPQVTLFKASTVAQFFECKSNKLGMYLARRRDKQDEGIYQASEYKYKPKGCSGLKSGGYFLTSHACIKFKRHFAHFADKRSKKHERQNDETSDKPRKKGKKSTENEELDEDSGDDETSLAEVSAEELDDFKNMEPARYAEVEEMPSNTVTAPASAIPPPLMDNQSADAVRAMDSGSLAFPLPPILPTIDHLQHHPPPIIPPMLAPPQLLHAVSEFTSNALNLQVPTLHSSHSFPSVLPPPELPPLPPPPLPPATVVTWQPLPLDISATNSQGAIQSPSLNFLLPNMQHLWTLLSHAPPQQQQPPIDFPALPPSAFQHLSLPPASF